MRIVPSAASVAALVGMALAACQNPSSVGLGLLDDDTSEPSGERIEATSPRLVEAETTTGGFALGDGSPRQTRVLVGSVSDPIYGDATARAYLDAATPTQGRPTNFQDSTLTAVALRLRLDESVTVVDDDTTVTTYVYGDPAASLPIEVREVTTNWAPTDLAVDATLSTGDVIGTATLTPSDTTLVIDLDEAWLAANADAIRSTDFLTEFEGFEIRLADGAMPNAIRGVDATRSTFLVATGADTLEFPINEVLTSLEQSDGSSAPGVLALRAGRPQALALDFDFASVQGAALARAEVRLPLDRADTGGTTFVRPLSREALLVGVTDDTLRTQLAIFRIRDDGDATTIGGGGFTQAMQEVLIGTASYERYEISLPSNPVSLDVLPVQVVMPPGAPGPRFTLTVVGQPTRPS